MLISFYIKACDLIYQGVKAGIANINNITPYHIKGPVELQLLQSEGHIPALSPVLLETIEANTINKAFMKFKKAMPWTSFEVNHPDGFQYPSGKIRSK